MGGGGELNFGITQMVPHLHPSSPSYAPSHDAFHCGELASYHLDVVEMEDRQHLLEGVVSGHHMYKHIWTPFISEKLQLIPEEGNEHDSKVVAILKGSTHATGMLKNNLVLSEAYVVSVRCTWIYPCVNSFYFRIL